MAAKETKGRGQGKGEATAPSTAPPQGMLKEQAETVRATEEYAELQKRLLAKRDEIEAKRLKFQAKMAKDRQELAAKERTERGILVLVQQHKDRPVKLRGGVMIPSRQQVRVTRSELRILQGRSRRGYIQLIVGELEKPGAVILPKDKRKAAAKAAKAEG